MEVIVVDNNSGDSYLNTIEKKFSNFRFIRNRINGGYANGCNLAFAYSTGNAVLILNPDTVVNEDAVEALLHASLQYPEYYVVSCRQVREDGSEAKATGRFPALLKHSSGAKGGKNLSHNQTDKTVSFPDWVSGSVMMIRREVFEKLGGFDEDFWMYSEDVDLCRRARDMGGNIAFYNNITIEHNHGGSSRIDITTASVTKCEVQKSRHLYIHKHTKGAERIILHSIIILDNLFTGLLAGIAGLFLFFIPKLFVRSLLFVRLLSYYSDSLLRGSWKSRRAAVSPSS
jgi:GT2 family glycosyltransferase